MSEEDVPDEITITLFTRSLHVEIVEALFDSVTKLRCGKGRNSVTTSQVYQLSLNSYWYVSRRSVLDIQYGRAHKKMPAVGNSFVLEIRQSQDLGAADEEDDSYVPVDESEG